MKRRKTKNRWLGVFGLMLSMPVLAIEDGFDCVMEPSDIVEISSPVQGVLESVAVERGDFVKKGQVLARLQSGVEQANLELAKAKAAIDVDIQARKADHEMKDRSSQQMEKLYAKHFVSLHEYDDAKTVGMIAQYDYKKAVEQKHLADLEAAYAQQLLNQRTLKSTIDGVVVERMKSAGEFIEEQPVLKIAQVDPIYVEIILPVEQLDKVQPGMTGEVRAESPVSKTYQAKVAVIDPIVHASSGTFGVRLVLPNPERTIKAGLRCKVSFPIESVKN